MWIHQKEKWIHNFVVVTQQYLDHARSCYEIVESLNLQEFFSSASKC